MASATLSWYSVNSTGDVLTFSGDKFQVSGDVDVVDGGNYLREGVPIFGAGGGVGEEGGDNVSLPIGSFIPYPWPASETDLPFGFLKCDGRYVSQVAYSQLFAVFGTKYGIPPAPFDTTHFYIPNFSNHIVKFVGTGGAQSTDYLPIGSIFILPWTLDPYPEGYLKCDGTEKTTEDYPLLSRVIGNTFGTPSDGNNFVLPNIFNHGIKYKITTDSENGSVTPWISVPNTDHIYYPSKVGIGTAQPDRLFHTAGNVRLGSFDFYGKGPSTNRQSVFFIPDDETRGTPDTDEPGGTNNSSGFGIIFNGDSVNDIHGLGPGQFGICSFDGNQNKTAVNAVTIEKDGKVGIGTTTLTSKFTAFSSDFTGYFQSDSVSDSQKIFQVQGGVNTGLVVTGSGWVGVGTVPIVPFEVFSGLDKKFYNDYEYFENGGDQIIEKFVPTIENPFDTRTIAIRTNGSIWVDNGARFIASSDERIKRNFSKIDDGKALSMLRLIEPYNYKYVDRRQGNMEVFGFLAQQVREHFPEAVALTKGFIPNVYRRIRPDFRGLKLDIASEVWNKLSLGETVRLKVFTKLGEKVLTVQRGEEWVYFSKGDLTGYDLSPEGEIFVYGFEVTDFHTLDKNYLFTINFAATQELDRKVQTLENEKMLLVQKVLELDSKLTALNSKLVERGLI